MTKHKRRFNIYLMSPATPFYVRGIKVSVHNKNLVRFYHVTDNVDDHYQELFDNITQYLMDEMFITVKKCKVEIICN